MQISCFFNSSPTSISNEIFYILPTPFQVWILIEKTDYCSLSRKNILLNEWAEILLDFRFFCRLPCSFDDFLFFLFGFFLLPQFQSNIKKKNRKKQHLKPFWQDRYQLRWMDLLKTNCPNHESVRLEIVHNTFSGCLYSSLKQNANLIIRNTFPKMKSVII